MRAFLSLAVLAATAAAARPTPDRVAAKPSCEAYTDLRELRFRIPAATLAGHIVAGSIVETGTEPPEAGQQLVFGSADLADDAGGCRRVSYAYWNTRDGCGGWEPARGARFVFDLADDKARDGTLRVMRYGEDRR